MRLARFVVPVAMLVVPATSVAGPVTGKLDLPTTAPERPQVGSKGFIDRIENPRKTVQRVNVTQYLLVVLEGETKPEGAGQVPWDLVGESFQRAVVGVPVGAELVIKNQSKTARTLTALEDGSLLQPPGPINPTGTKSFRASAPKIYTITDKDAPHLRGKVVVVATPYVATVDANGRFEFPDVNEGTYTLRIFYQDNWIERADDTITVGTKKQEITAKVPAGYPLKK
jgi:hypothetical protein